MPSEAKKMDQNGNEIQNLDSEEQRQNRINANMARFLSTEKQQKQLLLCLRQQEMPKKLRMGKLTKTTVAYGHEAFLERAVELLEPELKPIPPQPNCPESMQVYQDHRLMAADYLEVQKQLEDMRTYKKELEENLRQSEIQMEDLASKTENGEAKKFVQLQKEKDSLIQFRDKLSTQLQMIKKAQNDQTIKKDQENGVGSTPPTTNLEEDWVLVHGSKAEKS